MSPEKLPRVTHRGIPPRGRCKGTSKEISEEILVKKLQEFLKELLRIFRFKSSLLKFLKQFSLSGITMDGRIISCISPETSARFHPESSL